MTNKYAWFGLRNLRGLILLSPLLLSTSGCVVVSVASGVASVATTVVETGVSVTATAVSTTASVAKSVVTAGSSSSNTAPAKPGN